MMLARRFTLAAALVLTWTVSLGGCPLDDDDDDGDVAMDTSADTPGDTASDLQWYQTCGDPVCSGYTEKPNTPKCTTQQVGDACANAGELCDPVNGCNALLQCTDSDPTGAPFGCPISRRAAKKDIHYLTPAEVEAARKALMALPLATWRYHVDGADRPARLGFILEDAGQSPAVDADRGVVDIYGFTAMAAAALQAQQQQIEALEREVAALKAALDAKGPATAP